MDPFAGQIASRAAAEANSAARAAERNRSELDALRERVTDLETTVIDLLRALSADGIITVE